MAQKGVGKAVPAGGELPLLLNELGVEAALQRHLLHQLLVVVGDVQPLGDRLADGAPAASELAADGDDLLFHSHNLLVMMGAPGNNAGTAAAEQRAALGDIPIIMRTDQSHKHGTPVCTG